MGSSTVGTVTAKDDGSFELITLGPRPAVSEIQGQAIVDLDNDNSLRVAYDVLLEQVAAASN